jgi:hypothetical protein
MVVLVHGCGHGQRVVARAGVYLAELAEAAATAKARLRARLPRTRSHVAAAQPRQLSVDYQVDYLVKCASHGRQSTQVDYSEVDLMPCRREIL